MTLAVKSKVQKVVWNLSIIFRLQIFFSIIFNQKCHIDGSVVVYQDIFRMNVRVFEILQAYSCFFPRPNTYSTCKWIFIRQNLFFEVWYTGRQYFLLRHKLRLSARQWCGNLKRVFFTYKVTDTWRLEKKS